jgi:all-trans-retinol 13,14-reductase
MGETLQKDLIIIGAGLNGLSAGLAYALNNQNPKKKVLILEKSPISGGYVASFTRQGFQFDTTQMISNISNILDYFGVKMDFYSFDKDFIRVFKAEPSGNAVKTFELYSSAGDFEEQFYRLFPDLEPRLKKFFAYSEAMFAEIYGLKYAPGALDILKMLLTCPKVLGNINKTFSEYLKMFALNDPDIDLLFQVFSSMCGLPNERIAALLTVGVMYSLREKAYRPKGAFKELPRKLEQRFTELGGEISFKSEVDRILVERGQVKGVRLKDGEIIQSAKVISTLDVKTTIKDLVGWDNIHSLNPRYAKKLEEVEMTTSTFTVNLGLDDIGFLNHRKLHCGYALLTSGSEAFPRLFADFQSNRWGLTDQCFNIGLSCPPTTDQSKPVLTLQALPVPVENWQALRREDRPRYLQEKEKMGAILIAIVEKYLLPGLSKHIVVKDISTPATYIRYSGSPSGSIYDMASVPANFGNHRLPVITPIRGLLLPKFAHGAFGSMNSGLQAVDILLKGKVMQGNSRFK